MRKADLVAALRDYARTNLSPRPEDRTMVSEVYEAIKLVLGTQSTIQIGSFARFTAVRPLHDLDVLYVAGDYQDVEPNPSAVLDGLQKLLNKDFKNPTRWSWQTKMQTHSVSIVFSQQQTEKFSVDIVPAYRSGRNEFGLDKYVVPEILAFARNQRAAILNEVRLGTRTMGWIKSDPRGYTQAATNLNAINEDFRRASKILKGWRRATKHRYNDFPLKSFHLEQAVFEYFASSPTDTVFDAVFNVLRNIRTLAKTPRFRDRAEHSKFIDEYVRRLSTEDRELAEQAADYFLIGLERAKSSADVARLFSGEIYRRNGAEETYLFDQGIPVFSEHTIPIVAEAQEGDGFRRKILDAIGWIARSRSIYFRVGKGAPDCDMFKWKVKNDNNCAKPRGEITDHRTKSDPERTTYIGDHYVECYAIKNGVCIGVGHQDVRLNPQNTEQ